MRSEEGRIDVPGGRVWYRSLGEKGTPLLCLHGGPGFPHDYLEALAQLAGERRIIFYDQLGCGNSDRPSDTSLWTVDRFVAELVAVRAALNLDRVHLLGNSWGGMLALQYTLDRQPALDSLVLVGAPASMPRWSRDCAELLEEEPTEVRETIRQHEANGFTDCPEYVAATLGFYRKHVCRLRPWPVGLERAYAAAGYEVYHTMIGPSEFTVTGSLRDWDVTERLGEIGVPTLLLGGRHDECRPAHLEDMRRRIPDSRVVTIEDASHLCFAEQWDTFHTELTRFLAEVEVGPVPPTG